MEKAGKKKRGLSVSRPSCAVSAAASDLQENPDGGRVGVSAPPRQLGRLGGSRAAAQTRAWLARAWIREGDVDMLRTDALLQINSKVKKDAESQSAAGGSGTSAQPSDAQQHVAADAPASQSKRRKRTQSQPFEVNIDFEKDLALAIRLSAAEAQTSTPAASRVQDAEQSAIHAQQEDEDARGSDGACALGPQADVAQRAPGCAESERKPDSKGSLAPAKVTATTLAVKGKSTMTPAVATGDAISARDTRKKRPRFADSDDESDQEKAASPSLPDSPEPVRKLEQVSKSSKRKTIEDSDEDEIPQAVIAGAARLSASKSGRGQVSEFKVVDDEAGSEESGDSPGTNRGLESDMIPDSENEGEGDEGRAAGSDGGGVGKTKKALAEKQGPKVVVSRKRVVQANSSEDEDSAFDKHPGHASESEPQAKAQARAQVAKGRGKKVIGSQDEDDADDADDDDAAISEAEESDEDFESDEDDDFKGKKGKGKRLSDKGGKQTGKGKKQAHAKTTPASRSKKLSPPGKMPSHRNPPAPEMPAVDVATGNPGQVDKKAAAGRRRTKQEKALAELAFSNPGVKAAVGSRSRSGTEPFLAPPPVQAPAAQSTDPASNIATGPGAQQPQKQAVVGANVPPKSISKAPQREAAPPAPPSTATPPVNGVSRAGKEPLNPRPTATASSAPGLGGTVASMPPRVGLGKNYRPSTPLHRSGTAAPAAGGSRPTAGRGGGVTILGSTGVRQPGLKKNALPSQQLHMRPAD